MPIKLLLETTILYKTSTAAFLRGPSQRVAPVEFRNIASAAECDERNAMALSINATSGRYCGVVAPFCGKRADVYKEACPWSPYVITESIG